MADVGWAKRAAAATAAAAGAAALVLALTAGRPPEPPAPAATGTAAPDRTGFHAEVVPLLPEGGDGPCLRCHPAAAHRSPPNLRAFLNLHRRALDCGVCHLAGRGLSVRRFRDGRAVTADTLADAAGGRLYAAARGPDGWRPVDAPGDGARLDVDGPACRSCHRRGSPLLAQPGLYDPYRRRLLEDLSVLPRLSGATR